VVAWRVIFSVMYFAILCVCVYHLSILYNTKVLLQMRGKVHFSILLYVLCRIVFIAGDPLLVGPFSEALVIELFYGLGLYFLFTAYFLVLLFWMETYYKTPGVGKGRNLRPFFYVVDAILFVVQIADSVLAVIGIDANTIQLIYGGYLVLVCLIFCIGFLIFGTLIYRRLTQTIQGIKVHGDTHRVRTLTLITLSISALILITTITVAVLVVTGAENNQVISPCLEYSLEGLLTMVIIYVTRPLKAASRKGDSTTATNTAHQSDSRKMDDEMSNISDGPSSSAQVIIELQPPTNSEETPQS